MPPAKRGTVGNTASLPDTPGEQISSLVFLENGYGDGSERKEEEPKGRENARKIRV